MLNEQNGGIGITAYSFDIVKNKAIFKINR